MLILLTNDDGIAADGLAALVAELSAVARLVVVAPESPRNAASRSFSLDRPVRLVEVAPDRHAVDGSPVDCVYLGLHHVLRGQRPDLLLSGINHGPNLAQDVTYSGTVGAAMEATDWGIPAAAISLAQREDGSFAFAHAARFVRQVVLPLLAPGRLPAGVLLNVNVPRQDQTSAAERGALPWRVTRLGRHHYLPLVTALPNPRGRAFYWLGGQFGSFEPIPGSDCVAVAEGFASVTPLGLDLTSELALPALQAVAGDAAD